MKKLFVLVVSALFVLSCSEEIEFNTPALQGDKDGVLWRADYYSAEINAGGQLVVTGGKGSESVVLRFNSANEGTYVLGEGSSSAGLFFDAQDLEYSTNNEPDPSVQVYPADGEITISEYDATSNVVSGSFWYNAFSATGLNKVNLSQGVFYRIPVVGGTGTVVVSCDDAVAASAEALAAYEATDEMSEDFSTVCNEYSDALMQQITSCGDDTGVLQDIIDGLECGTVVVPGGCQTCTGGTFPETEYCDNGDGTITITITGFPPTSLDLAGTSFEDYIAGLESSGLTCN